MAKVEKEKGKEEKGSVRKRDAARGTKCPRAVFSSRGGGTFLRRALLRQAMRSAESVTEALAAVSAMLIAAELVRRTSVSAPATSSA